MGNPANQAGIMNAIIPCFAPFRRGSRLATKLEHCLLLGQETMVDCLLAEGRIRSLLGKCRIPPLLAAIQPAGSGKTNAVRERLVGRLLSVGADPNARASGFTPLLLAAGHGTTVIVRSLLVAGARVDAKDHQGRNALHHAADSNQPVELALALLEAGIEPDAEDYLTGFTPLAMYARNHNAPACRILLAAGANPNARHHQLDVSPREAAHAIGSQTIIGILEEGLPCCSLPHA